MHDTAMPNISSVQEIVAGTGTEPSQPFGTNVSHGHVSTGRSIRSAIARTVAAGLRRRSIKPSRPGS